MPTAASMRVLVADDNDDAAQSLSMLLTHLGHQAAVAQDGEAALQLAPLFRPDAMFIDLAMPKIDGLTLARRFRETLEFADTPLIAVSGYVDAEHRAQAASAGFTDFLAKPYPLVALQDTLARVRTRIEAGRRQAEMLRKAAEESQRLVDRSRKDLGLHWQNRRLPASRVRVSLEKSGSGDVLSLSQMPDAEELRCWLACHDCWVGEIFEPTPGRFAFFVYSRRHRIGDLIAKHGGFRPEHTDN